MVPGYNETDREERSAYTQQVSNGRHVAVKLLNTYCIDAQ